MEDGQGGIALSLGLPPVARRPLSPILGNSPYLRLRTIQAGSISSLELVEGSIPPLERGQVVVSVKAVGLNFADVFSALGLYGATPKGSFVPGLEFSGVVAEVGPDSPISVRVGDRVMGCTRFGAYTTRIAVPASQLRPLPEDWSFKQGAAFLVQGLTVMYGLRQLGQLDRGETALIHSAAGGCGQFALKVRRPAEQMGGFPIIP